MYIHGRAISVKLVSEAGVGTIAAGVAKAHADAVHIAGHDGGTGASPLSSIHHAGAPWELGLAEAQQVLVKNDLRGRVVVQVDGQLKTGRDVAIAALLGAEEFGFATAPLVASGCVMMRKCHLNTCPVGIATQDPVLRARFRGTPEDVIRYFFFVAEELRGIMASLGFRDRRRDGRPGRASAPAYRRYGIPRRGSSTSPLSSPRRRIAARMVGANRASRTAARGIWRSTRPSTTVSSTARASPSSTASAPGYRSSSPTAIARSAPCSRARSPVATALAVSPTAPSASKRAAPRGRASAPSSRPASRSVSSATPTTTSARASRAASSRCARPRRRGYVSSENSIVGNTVLYGATSGRAFFAGRAGERFAVRNSGAVAVCEGVGDHGCEYMTGGLVVVLGPTGRNFGAGMSGGIAYVEDADGKFSTAG